jgi:hypothetical protein
MVMQYSTLTFSEAFIGNMFVELCSWYKIHRIHVFLCTNVSVVVTKRTAKSVYDSRRILKYFHQNKLDDMGGTYMHETNRKRIQHFRRETCNKEVTWKLSLNGSLIILKCILK